MCCDGDKMPRIFATMLFEQAAADEEHSLHVSVQYVEIYNEQLRDLLTTQAKKEELKVLAVTRTEPPPPQEAFWRTRADPPRPEALLKTAS